VLFASWAIGIGSCVVSGCAGNQNVFNPQGPQARSIATLGWALLVIAGLVYVVVIATLFWAMGRRRRETDMAPETTKALERNVAAASAVTIAVLVVLVFVSVVSGRGLTSPSGAGAITVDVIGHQWWWDFRYHDVTPSDVVTSPNELHIPVGVPVVLKAQSTDVIHSFWAPNLYGKRDLIPGEITNTWIQADTPGVYRGQCAEFCGAQHAHMAFVVVAEPMDAFLKWIEHQREPAVEPASDDARRGHDVFMQGPCVLCHSIQGTSAGSHVGPDLTHVGSRLLLAAGTLPNTRGHLGGWVADSQSIKPGNRMPPNALTPADLQAVLTYVRSLR
jgi:cytochrome c oxidase subunit 2